MTPKVKVDIALRRVIGEYGVHETLAALCRYCNDSGWTVLFRKLNRVYEWLMGARI